VHCALHHHSALHCLPTKALSLKGVTSLASLDVYCFGHILYEVSWEEEKGPTDPQMSVGRPLPTATMDAAPGECPDLVSECPPCRPPSAPESVLVSLLSPAATRQPLPSVAALLATPLLALPLPAPQAVRLKLSAATKVQGGEGARCAGEPAGGAGAGGGAARGRQGGGQGAAQGGQGGCSFLAGGLNYWLKLLA
jgi:hypothetical protein